VADGWRYCFNCGTATADAVPTGGSGLSSDEVAEVIAAPAGDDSVPPTPVVEEPAYLGEPSPGPTEPLVPEIVPEEDAAAEPPIVAEERVVEPPSFAAPADTKPQTGPDEPTVPDVVAPENAPPMVTGPDVSFEPNPDLGAGAAEMVAPPQPEWAPPQPTDDLETAPPAPPSPLPDQVGDLSPPDTPQPPPSRSVEPAAHAAASSLIDPFDAAERERGGAVTLPEEDVVHIPQPKETPTVRREIPQPIGAPSSPERVEIPRPIGEKAAQTERAPEPRPRVAVPERPRPQPADVDEADLPPLSAHTFHNPGLLGQGLQLALIAAAAVAVLMILGLTLLNNRLAEYAESGEGLNRIESAESLINTWLRPVLAIAIVLAYVVMVWWARRALRNLEMFERPVPEAAPWMWLIPGANIFVLYQHIDLARKGSDSLRRVANWRQGAPDPWNAAFAFLATIGFGVIIYAALLGNDTFEQAIDANSFSMVGYGMLAIALLCGARAVGTVLNHQRSRAESFG